LNPCALRLIDLNCCFSLSVNMPWRWPRCALLAEVRSLHQNIRTPEGVSPPLVLSHLTQMMANAFIATSRWIRYHTLSISFNLDFHSVLHPCWACTDAVQTWPHLVCMRWLRAWQVRCSCHHAHVISYIAYSGLRTLPSHGQNLPRSALGDSAVADQDATEAFYGPQWHEVLERLQNTHLQIGVLRGKQGGRESRQAVTTKARWKRRSLVGELVAG
jgi:hypothetical protein